MRYFILVAIVALQIFLLNCDELFDKEVNKVDSLMQVKAYGYINRNNYGSNKGCCGTKQKDKCDACQYRLEVKSTLKAGIDTPARTTTLIATFSAAATNLFENYQASFLYSTRTYDTHQLGMVSLSYLSDYADIYPKISSSEYSNYRYSFSYGVRNIILLAAEAWLRPRGDIRSYAFAMLRVDSIRWIKNQDSAGSCCSGNQIDGCPDKCGYYIEWRVGDNYIDKSDSLIEHENNNFTRISYTLVSQSSKLRARPINYNIDIVSSNTGKLVDRVVLPNITNIPNVEYSKNQISGIYGNIMGSLSYMHNCNSYGGYNCINFCSTDSGTEFCDLDEGKTYCLNGASDANSCENLPKTCIDGLCRNGGICLYNNGDVFCSCPFGYTGKLCQDWQCDSRCNGNGNCIGPNECNCNFPFSGSDCDEYPCLGNNTKTCYNGGTCKVVSGKPVCRCQAPFFQGDDCSETICTPACVFGKCKYVTKLKISNCVCSELYQGSSCSELRSKFPLDSRLKVPLIIVITILILLFAALFGLYFRYRKGVPFLPISRINIIDSTLSNQAPSDIAAQNEPTEIENAESTKNKEWSSNVIVS